MYAELAASMPIDMWRAFVISHDAERYTRIYDDEFGGSELPEWYSQMPSSLQEYYDLRWSVHSDLMGTSIATYLGLALATDCDGSTITAGSTMTMP